MKLRKIVWILIILLIIVTIWEIINLKKNYKEIANKKSEDDDKIKGNLIDLQRKVGNQENVIKKIENIAIWNQENDTLSLISRQAIKSAVKVVGIEHFPTEKNSNYERIPVNVTIRGNYSALGKFINELERSEKKLRIDSLRIRYKEHKPEELTMDVLISYFIKNEP